MAINYSRGSASIQEAANRKGTGGTFRPFLPQIQWKKDGERKYVLVLTDMQEVAGLLLHQFVPVGKGTKSNGEEFTRYEDFISRRDNAIGEDHDDLEDRLEREPKLRHMGVMVELEAIFEPGTGKKLKGFVVKTDTFTRKTDDGDIEVTQPLIGLCTQSAQLMWGPLDNLFHQVGDLIDVPLSITKHGEKTNTRYDTVPFLEKPVNLAPIIEHLDGISYIADEDVDELILAIDAAESDQAKAQVVADYLLIKRITELADGERYKEYIEPLELEDIPKAPWERKSATNGKTPARAARPARRSPREAAEDAPEPAAKAEPAKSERFAALKNRVERSAT